ncbi:MAG: TerC family protein [Thermoanaerobaculia bacterium]
MLPTVASPVLWGAFLAGILVLLILDLKVFHGRDHAERFGAAVGWSVFWIALSLAFNLWVYLEFGSQAGLDFLAGYVIEKSLSVDNIFVFLVIFRYFAVPPKFQHRALFWGVMGAIVLRGVFVLLGTALLARFHWVIYIFGALLVYTGYRLLTHGDIEVHPERNPVVRLVRRFVPITKRYHGHHLWVRLRGRLAATPLLLVLLVIETTDVVFAVDSIPAVFAITRDPFIVFTSNIMAVLGLRALYFVLAGMMHRFRYLHYGLGLVLAFVGVKMLIEGFVHIPTQWSLLVVALLIAGSMIVSWLSRGPTGGPAADTIHDE